MKNNNEEPVNVKLLYREFENIITKPQGIVQEFSGLKDMDIYNPSVPFTIKGATYIAGRVEERSSERSRVMFFKKTGDVWDLCKEAMTFELQDPFITFIDSKLIMGGVRVVWEEGTNRATAWYTDFYIGSGLDDLHLFASGPKHMKDIRLVELSDKRIGIFTRPQGEQMLNQFGCIAKIGFMIVDSLEDITAAKIEQAAFIEGIFRPDEWGGCNQIHLLKNGHLGIVGHIAYGEEKPNARYLHYYGMSFIFDPVNKRIVDKVKIIISRDCFPDGPCKAQRLSDVTFTSGIQRLCGNKAVIYTGLSDAQVGSAVINDPFAEWEEGVGKLE